MKMRKVMLDVELMTKDRVVFAYCCVGVETQRNLYVKVDTDQYIEKPYIKIQKKDTKVYRLLYVPSTLILIEK